MSDFPIILIEGVLVGGGVLLFGWWQIREVNKRIEARKRREAKEAKSKADSDYEPVERS